MKQDTLQSLFDKYREGTITDSERSELERLSHKDEVFSAARSRAAGIIRRRVALAVSVLMICGAGVWAIIPGGNQTPLMADAGVGTPHQNEVREVVSQLDSLPQGEQGPQDDITRKDVRPAPQSTPEHSSALPQTPRHSTTLPRVEKSTNEPVVVCNNQCDADSVINDIRRFLAYEENGR